MRCAAAHKEAAPSWKHRHEMYTENLQPLRHEAATHARGYAPRHAAAPLLPRAARLLRATRSLPP